MCYFALVEAAYYEYMRQFGADIDFRTFYELYVRRDEHGRIIKLLRGMDQSFAQSKTDLEREIAALVAKHDAAEIARLDPPTGPLDHGILNTPLRSRMPSDAKISRLADLWARRKHLESLLGVWREGRL